MLLSSSPGHPAFYFLDPDNPIIFSPPQSTFFSIGKVAGDIRYNREALAGKIQFMTGNARYQYLEGFLDADQPPVATVMGLTAGVCAFPGIDSMFTVYYHLEGFMLDNQSELDGFCYLFEIRPEHAFPILVYAYHKVSDKLDAEVYLSESHIEPDLPDWYLFEDMITFVNFARHGDLSCIRVQPNSSALFDGWLYNNSSHYPIEVVHAPH